jgi:dienelactone hydrolase
MISRRELFIGTGCALGLFGEPTALPGTRELTWEGDLSERMMDGAHQFVERKIAESTALRKKHWSRDFSSREAYEKSVAPNRVRFAHKIGLADQRLTPSMERFGDDVASALVADAENYRVYQVRWPVLEGVFGEGLLLEPKQSPAGFVVAMADADQTPEQIVGLAKGIPAENQFARRLAENGFEVIVPALIDRSARWSGDPNIRMTDQPHREWIYRQAYHMGRHVIGYEVQKVLAAVDWFRTKAPAGNIGVAGYCEGGLVALYAAAVDPRITAVLVSGYFESRQRVWSEPIYRNVWGLLTEFGDAEIATLIAPRGLAIEYSRVPDQTSPKGDLRTPAFESVSAEYHRIDTLLPNRFQARELISGEGRAPAGPGSRVAIEAFVRILGSNLAMPLSTQVPADARSAFDPGDRQKRQVREAEKHVQTLIRAAGPVRERFFLYKVMPELADDQWSTESRHKTFPAKRFIEGAREYRRYFTEHVMGTFGEPLLPANARTRPIRATAQWTEYEVVLDVWPEVFAWGLLLIPSNIRTGERRPVVVCQHGRRGLPQETVEGDSPYYHDFAARLAERGFVTFAPHNLYRGEDRYRWLCRKSNNVQATLFSFIIAQHDQILRWLGSLPMVDASRIGFYGLSYGGESAVRLPAALEGYALSICSGDFNSWTEKVAATDLRFGFMYSVEWEMPYFNMGNTFDYAEMTYLILPRPFMVERGHNDRVSRDQWVAQEYAKVRWLYTQLGLADKTAMEYFNGGHTIHGEETFRFLHKHLNWPEPG